jgi:hypothetical protein
MTPSKHGVGWGARPWLALVVSSVLPLLLLPAALFVMDRRNVASRRILPSVEIGRAQRHPRSASVTVSQNRCATKAAHPGAEQGRRADRLMIVATGLVRSSPRE